MAAPLRKPVKILLEKGCDFQIGIRKGRVLELRGEGYYVFWEAWSDPTTGECHESEAGVITFDAIVTENNYGTLRVLRRPLAKSTHGEQPRRSERDLQEIARKRFRQQFVLAIEEMLDSGELRETRDDFCEKIVQIVARGTRRYDEYLAAQKIREGKRGGAKVSKSKRQIERVVEFHQGYKSGHTMWKWYRQWKTDPHEGLFDQYRNCGKYNRFDDATTAFALRILDPLYDQERANVKSLVESVQAAINAENERREKLPIPAAKIKKVGYDYVLRLIKENAPINSAIWRSGWEKAYKDMHALGLGVTTSRALERVEIDEYTVDLFILMEATGIFDHLPASIKKLIGLDGSACRVTLSAAIDVHTRCLLALQIVPQASEGQLRQTLEMIYMDKSAIADAAGAKFGWPMSGAPEAIVFDRGYAYITDNAYDVLASLGVTNLGAPAGKPWLKPFIERVFRTIHSDLLVRFSGRAFSNVVDREENDAAARATLTLEDFLVWLVRWTVDAYHTRKHAALGMSPAQAWARATKECAPGHLTSEEMREAFGERMWRKLGRKGVLVGHLHYQNDALMDLHLKTNVDEVEVSRWHGDIGAISVRVADGPWITVTVCDPIWIGKTDTDFRVWLADRPTADQDELTARRDFINDANEDSIKRKKLAGIVSMPRTNEELEADVSRFKRHADTAERRHVAGAHRDLLEDLDDGADVDVIGFSGACDKETDDATDHQVFSEEDSME